MSDNYTGERDRGTEKSNSGIEGKGEELYNLKAEREEE